MKKKRNELNMSELNVGGGMGVGMGMGVGVGDHKFKNVIISNLRNL